MKKTILSFDSIFISLARVIISASPIQLIIPLLHIDISVVDVSLIITQALEL